MKPQHLLACCILLVLQLAQLLPAQDKVTEFANDLELTGTLGDGLRIEMHLQRTGNAPFWEVAGGECFDVTGQYFYRSQIRKIELKGRICPGNRTLELSYPAYDDVEWQERFVGKWDAKLGTYAGEWTLKKTNKTLPFALKVIGEDVQDADKQAFFALMDQELSTGPEDEWFMTQYRIEAFQWQAGTGKAVNTVAVEVRQFSPMRFDCYHNWSNAGNGNDQIETFQLMPSPTGMFALQCYGSHYASPAGESDDGELLFDEGCESILHLWRWANGKWEDVTAQGIPAAMLEALGSNLPEHECEVQILHDALRVGKLKRYWVDGKFVEKP